jgi:hypothetical protein
MSERTENYNMLLPAQEDYYNVEVFNDNYSVIDKNLHRVENAVEGLAEVAKSGGYNDLLKRPYTTCASVAEFNVAINAMDDNGGVICLLPGEYEFSADINIDKDNITVIGSGMNTVIKLSADKRLWVLGNYVTFEGLKIAREDESSKELILLDTMGTHSAKGFKLDGVYIECGAMEGASGLIEVTSVDATELRLLNCTVVCDASRLIHTGSKVITGVVSGCISSNAMTVPATTTSGEQVIMLGANLNVKAGA